MSELDEEKLFYERFYALHHDPVLLRLCEAFGIRIFRRSSVLEGFASALSEFGFRGSCCVEIGTNKGLTSIVLSRFFDQVYSIDVEYDDERVAIAREAGVTNVTRVVVENNAEKYRYIAGLKFDAAFVDGDHARDTETDFAAVRHCGQVLFHEYWGAQPAVKNLVDRLAAGPGRVAIRGKFARWIA